MIPQIMTKFYINGEWVEPISKTRLGVENPATEEIVCEVAMGNADPRIKAIADIVSEDALEDGLAKAFVRLFDL